MTIKDWIKAPADWDEWGSRFNAWMTELVLEARSLAGRISLIESELPAGNVVTWSPVLTQPGVVGGDVYNYRGYRVTNNTCFGWFSITAGGAGVAGNPLKVDLPVAIDSGTVVIIGSAIIFDASTGTRYNCSLENIAAEPTRGMFVSDVTGSNGWGGAPSIAIASGDVIRGTFCYPIAI